MPWAELEIIDLGLLDSPDPSSRAALVKATKKALIEDGFLFVTGTGLSNDQLRRALGIAQHLLSIPEEDKKPYAAKLDQGSFAGYKLKGIWKKDGGVPDNLEVSCQPFTVQPATPL